MEVVEPRSDDEDQSTGNVSVPALNSSHADNAVASQQTGVATVTEAVVNLCIGTEAKLPVVCTSMWVTRDGQVKVRCGATDMLRLICPLCLEEMLPSQSIVTLDCRRGHRLHIECVDEMQDKPPHRGRRLQCPHGGCESRKADDPDDPDGRYDGRYLNCYHMPGKRAERLKGPKDWKQEDGAKAQLDAARRAAAAAGARRQMRSNDMPSLTSLTLDAAAVASDLLDLDAEDAAGPQADAEDRPPAGEGGLKRKRKKASGAQRAKKKAGKKAEEEDGGFTDKGRVAFKAEGGVLVTGGKRTCLPDALYMLLLSLSIPVDVEEVRTIMPADPSENTLFMAADNFVSQFGLTLQRVTSRFMSAKGGVALALLQASGYFVVQLRITAGKDDKDPDLHCVAYDGATVRDNYQWSKVKDLDEGDRASPASARKVFNSLFHRDLEVRIKNVYELMPL